MKYNKKEGPNSSSITELIDNLSKRVICCYIVTYHIRTQNLKFIGLKMVKIQCSDGPMGKRKIAILNIYSILNNFFWAK
jgi:hypothetical protein